MEQPNQTEPETQYEVIQGEKLTPEDEEIIAWIDGIDGRQIRLEQEALRMMIVLLTALLATVAVFYGQIAAHPTVKATASLLILTALGIAYRGWLPWTVTFDANDLTEAREVRGRLGSRKVWHMKACAACTLAALLVLLAGVMIFP